MDPDRSNSELPSLDGAGSGIVISDAVFNQNLIKLLLLKILKFSLKRVPGTVPIQIWTIFSKVVQINVSIWLQVRFQRMFLFKILPFLMFQAALLPRKLVRSEKIFTG